MGRRTMTTFAAGAVLTTLAWMTLAPAAWHPLAWFSFRAKAAVEPWRAAAAPAPTKAEERRTSVGPDNTPAATVAEAAEKIEPGTLDPAARPAGGDAEEANSASELMGSLAFSLPPSEGAGDAGVGQEEEGSRPRGMDPEQLLALFGTRRADAPAGGFLSRKGDSPARAEPGKAKAAEVSPEAPKPEAPQAAAQAEEKPESAPGNPQQEAPKAAEAPKPAPPAEELPPNPAPSAAVAEEAASEHAASEEELAPEEADEPELEPEPTPMEAVPASIASAIPREIPTPLQLAQRRLHPPAKPFNGALVVAPVSVAGRPAPSAAANERPMAPAPAAVEPTPEQLASLEVAAAKSAAAAESAPAPSPAPPAIPEAAPLPPADVQVPEPTPAPTEQPEPESAPIRSLFPEMAPAIPEAKSAEEAPKTPVEGAPAVASEEAATVPSGEVSKEEPAEQAPSASVPEGPEAPEGGIAPPPAEVEKPATPEPEKKPEAPEGMPPAPLPAPEEVAKKDALPPAVVPLIAPEAPKQEQPETLPQEQPEAPKQEQPGSPEKEVSAPAGPPMGGPISPLEAVAESEKPAVSEPVSAPTPAPTGLPPLSGLPAADPAPGAEGEAKSEPAKEEAPASAPGPMPPPEEVGPQGAAPGPEANPPGLPEVGKAEDKSPLVDTPEELQGAGAAAPSPAPEAMGELAEPAATPAPLADLRGGEDSPPLPTPGPTSTPAPEPEAVSAAPAKVDPFAEAPARPPTRALLPDRKSRNPGHLVDPFSEAVDPFDGTSAPDGAAVTMDMTSLLTKRVAAPIPTVRVMRGQSPSEEEQQEEGPVDLPATTPPAPTETGPPAPPAELPEPPVLGEPGKQKQEEAAPSDFPAELMDKDSPAPGKKGREKADDGFSPAGMADGQPPTVPATPPAGQPAAAAPPAAAAAPQPEPAVPVPPAGAAEAGAGIGMDRLTLGKQDLGLAIEVLSLPVTNLNKPAPFRVIVRNTSKSEIQGIVIRGTLPENFEYTESTPEAQRQGQELTWSLGSLAAGAEKTMNVRAIPKSTGAFEFGAIATVQSGAKARTTVQEPKLEVKLTATPTQVLKGRPVRFQIEVSNTGTGMAREVTVMARLSSGLKHTLGSSVVQKTIGDLKAGESIKLNPSLDLNTVAAGEQTCELTATSKDIPVVAAAATAKAAVAVVEPQLTFQILGNDRRYTDTLADYTVLLENPGTAPATNVRVLVTVPTGGSVESAGSGRYQEESRRIYWDIPQVEPGKPVNLPFKIRLGGIQIFRLTGATVADNSLRAQGELATNVEGIADVDVQIIDKPRILDVGDSTDFEVRVVNNGSKDATNVKISAMISTTLTVDGTVGSKGTKYDSSTGAVEFPPIGKIGPGEKITLKLKAKAVKSGTASCKVSVLHDESGTIPIEKSVVATITEASTTRR